MDMSDTLRCRRLLFENSAATALVAASMPPIPRPVTIRHIDRSISPVTVVAITIPAAMTARHASIGGRLPIQDRRPPPDPARHAAEEDRTERHPDQLHRQHDAQRGTVDPPLLGNARRREADREKVETVRGF